MNSSEFEALALLLRQGLKKEAVLFLKKNIDSLITVAPQRADIWKGWLNAIERDEASSLVSQLLSGLPDKEIKNTIREFRVMHKMVEQQDPINKKEPGVFFREWIHLLRAYQRIDIPKTTSQEIGELEEEH